MHHSLVDSLVCSISGNLPIDPVVGSNGMIYDFPSVDGGAVVGAVTRAPHVLQQINAVWKAQLQPHTSRDARVYRWRERLICSVLFRADKCTKVKCKRCCKGKTTLRAVALHRKYKKRNMSCNCMLCRFFNEMDSQLDDGWASRHEVWDSNDTDLCRQFDMKWLIKSDLGWLLSSAIEPRDEAAPKDAEPPVQLDT